MVVGIVLVVDGGGDRRRRADDDNDGGGVRRLVGVRDFGRIFGLRLRMRSLS